MKDCINTTNWLDKDGYGRRRYEGKSALSHRIAYCEANNVSLKSIAGKVIMHSCDNRVCINPQHLSLGTHEENVADRVRKGRTFNGYVAGILRHTKASGGNLVTQKTKDDIRGMFEHGCSKNGIKPLARRYFLQPKAIREILADFSH